MIQIHFLFKRDRTIEIKRDERPKFTRYGYKYFASRQTQTLAASLLPEKKNQSPEKGADPCPPPRRSHLCPPKKVKILLFARNLILNTLIEVKRTADEPKTVGKTRNRLQWTPFRFLFHAIFPPLCSPLYFLQVDKKKKLTATVNRQSRRTEKFYSR